jgi:hypothetical protein
MADLTKRTVKVYGIDPQTGLPIYPEATARPVQTTKRNRGDYPPAYNSLGEPWGGAFDQTVAQNSRVPQPAYNPFTDPDAGVSQGYVDGLGAPGKNQGTGPQIAESPGERAITEILVRGGTKPPTGGLHRGRHRPVMKWEPAVSVGPAPKGDPWGGGMRGGVQAAPIQGMVTGPKPKPKPATKQKSGAFGLFGLADAGRSFMQSLQAKQDANRAIRPITHNFAPVKSAGERFTQLGEDMAFQPRSVQTSSRWNTGY